jgi:DNA repair protein RadA/Sms
VAKPTTRYACQTCGTVHPKWQGKCEGCGAWNTLVEETSGGAGPRRRRRRPVGGAWSSCR